MSKRRSDECDGRVPERDGEPLSAFEWQLARRDICRRELRGVRRGTQVRRVLEVGERRVAFDGYLAVRRNRPLGNDGVVRARWVRESKADYLRRVRRDPGDDKRRT